LTVTRPVAPLGDQSFLRDGPDLFLEKEWGRREVPQRTCRGLLETHPPEVGNEETRQANSAVKEVGKYVRFRGAHFAKSL